MSANEGRWAWIHQPIGRHGLPRGFPAVWYPVERYRLTYAVVFGLVGLSTYSFSTYRVLASRLVALMPIVGILSGYLWAILLADELLGLFPIRAPVPSVIRKVKWGSLVVISVYGLAGLGLWLNSLGQGPLGGVPARIVSIATVDIGFVQYRAIALESVGNTTGRHTILSNASDERNLYAGEDVRLKVRRGMLSLTRILEVNEDMEKYYRRMLQAAPDARVALEGLVGIYADRREFVRAMEWDEKLRARYPDEVETTMQLGKRLTDARQFQDAITVFRKAAAVSRKYEVLYALGYALAWGGRRDEAAQYLQEATQVDPTDWRAFYSLGYVYSGLGRYAEAKGAWSKVLEFLPHFPEIEQNLKGLETKVH
jgi:Flp pilus assembly protein TadD